MSKKYYKVPENGIEYPFSAAVKAGDYVYLSGQPSMDLATGKYLDANFETQFAKCMSNLQEVLDAIGLKKDDVVKCTVFLTDMRDYPLMNELYVKWFGKPLPARSCMAVAGLPLGTKVEVEMIAYCGEK